MKKGLIKVITIIVSILLIIVILMYGLKIREKNNYLKRGYLLINKIETFKNKEKRLPNSVKELGNEEPMDEGPYYEKRDSTRYVVFFNIGFDETLIYYSDKKEWENEH